MNYEELCSKCDRQFVGSDDKLVIYCPRCGSKIAAFKDHKHIQIRDKSKENADGASEFVGGHQNAIGGEKSEP